jgi:hypothetical protein
MSAGHGRLKEYDNRLKTLTSEAECLQIQMRKMLTADSFSELSDCRRIRNFKDQGSDIKMREKRGP